MTDTRSTGTQIAVMNYHPRGHLGRDSNSRIGGGSAIPTHFDVEYETMTTIHMFQCLLVHTSAANILISISYYIGGWNKDCASTVVCGRLAFSCTKMS